MKIPRIIHQIYENPEIPEYLLKLSKTWKLLHPKWEYRFWNKQAINSFLESTYSEYMSIYKAFPFDVQRWDAIRYLILYHFGGLYTDLDYECIEPLDSLLSDNHCYMGMEPEAHATQFNKPYVVGNALMASIPGHPYFEKIIDDIFKKKNIVKYEDKAIHILETTGPFMTTRTYDAYFPKEEIILLPAELVAPLTLEEAREVINGIENEELEEKIEKAFAIHYFLGSWIPQTITK